MPPSATFSLLSPLSSFSYDFVLGLVFLAESPHRTILGIVQLRACQGRSYSGPIKLTPEISVLAKHCNGLHPSLDPGDQTIIWMMTSAPLIFPEDLKLILKEGMAKLCPIGIIVPREYEALLFCLSPREHGTPGHYLLVGMSTLSGAYMRLHDVLIFQLDFLQEAMPMVQPWHEPPFSAPSASDIMNTPRGHRNPGEVATNLKGRFRPKPQQGKQPQELRWVTTCLTSEPMDDSAPKYAGWEHFFYFDSHHFSCSHQPGHVSLSPQNESPYHAVYVLLGTVFPRLDDSCKSPCGSHRIYFRAPSKSSYVDAYSLI